MPYAPARSRAGQLQPAADPNVIPFIDVLLVLLIIFMVTAPKPTTDLKLDLTQAQAGAPPVIEPTIVDIRADLGGGYLLFIGDEQIAPDALATRTQALILARDPALTLALAHAEARVFVRSELDVAYAPVVDTIERLQLARFRNVAILAQDADAV